MQCIMGQSIVITFNKSRIRIGISAFGNVPEGPDSYGSQGERLKEQCTYILVCSIEVLILLKPFYSESFHPANYYF